MSIKAALPQGKFFGSFPALLASPIKASLFKRCSGSIPIAHVPRAGE